MKTWTIYEHISPSGKVYVGITCWPVEHRWENGAGYRRCTAFYRAIKKYGWDNIQHNIIATGLGEGIAKNMEKDLIAFNKAKGISYNITDGGDGSPGHKATEKQRIHAANIWKGKKIPRDIVEKSASKRRGVKLPKEQVDKIRLGKIGNGNGNKAVVQLKDGKIVNEFISCVEAARAVGTIPNCISRCCRREYSHWHEFIFVYKRDLKIFFPDAA